MVDNHNYMSNMCEKGLSDSNVNQAVIGKISIFKEIAPNFTYSQKVGIFQVSLDFFRQTACTL